MRTNERTNERTNQPTNTNTNTPNEQTNRQANRQTIERMIRPEPVREASTLAGSVRLLLQRAKPGRQRASTDSCGRMCYRQRGRRWQRGSVSSSPRNCIANAWRCSLRAAVCCSCTGGEVQLKALPGEMGGTGRCEYRANMMQGSGMGLTDGGRVWEVRGRSRRSTLNACSIE